jgi:hypothetical protein
VNLQAPIIDLLRQSQPGLSIDEIETGLARAHRGVPPGVVE